MAKNHPCGSKRPPLGHFYYETYNRDNLSLVDVSGTAIEAVNPLGLRLADGTEHELDMLVFATGFDAATGAITAMDIRGTDGQSITEFWQAGAQSHLGIATTGFPNLFMLAGPHSPFPNFPPVLETTVPWIGDAITHMRENGIGAIEADQDAMDTCQEELEVIVDETILRKGETVHTWFLGANILGKPHRVLFYLDGAPEYFADLHEYADSGYSGFTLGSRGAAPTPT
jgi:cation diffusion facilitator CzcD-associated flavoprotein CzcO